LSDLEKLFRAGTWRPVGEVDRSFVRNRNIEASPGYIWHHRNPCDQVELSVVIPTLDGYRNGYLPKLLAQIGRQEYSVCEIIVVRADPRQGRAINVGAAAARGKYLLTLDDDSSIPDPATFGKLAAVMEQYPQIGMAGGSNLVPKDASAFVKRVMIQLPRRSCPMVQKITDSDLAEHGCLIMRLAEFKSIGGENELIPRGLDPYLREEFRKLNKRIVLVPKVFYHHLPPANLYNLLRQFYRNGRQAAFTNRNFPQWVVETPSTHGRFKAHLPLSLRVCRFPIRLIMALITGKPIWFLSEVFYALGFAREWMALVNFHSPRGKDISRLNEG